MQKLHDIRVKSDAFISNMDEKINESIIFAENQIIDLNREQMKERQVDSKDNHLPEYSSFWKSIKGLTYFNLLDTGDFQNKMFMNVKYPDYSISSRDRKLNKILSLPKMNGIDPFGIAPSNQKEAQVLTGKAFAMKYKSYVLRK